MPIPELKLLDGNRNNRILIVDDNESIHEDFKKILTAEQSVSAGKVDELAESLFGDGGAPATTTQERFELTHAQQGQEALGIVQKSLKADKAFAVAFVDVRMPPGW